MPAVLLEGRKLADEIKKGLKKEVEALKKVGPPPLLVAIQVGENPASRLYTKQQKKASGEIGIDYELKELNSSITQQALSEFIEKLNRNRRISGIILQMPLPPHLDPHQAQVRISPLKDVEGVHPLNIGRLLYGDNRILPPVASGVIELLKSINLNLKGKEVVIVSHSEIVGKPIALVLLQSQFASPTVTICHIATKNLALHTRRAEVLIVATGKPNLIKADMLKEGSIVIDIGINRVPLSDEKKSLQTKIVGDVEFEKAKDVCSYITPVPGGIGPLTTALLLRNTLECAKLQR